ncbi:MAG TPA: hypothetical protein ENF48_06885 [Desulfobacteraceae bacterium]|nr:hypothetical protein [Deltaproteobacteria bacterium]MBW2355568.1 hypothetical protein [Deltaproteobacteria bacterium]HDI60059.1 hypothetical protein [Desulfobacteraceae bacterium]
MVFEASAIDFFRYATTNCSPVAKAGAKGREGYFAGEKSDEGASIAAFIGFVNADRLLPRARRVTDEIAEAIRGIFAGETVWR